MIIPKQLITADARFIKVLAGKKGAFEPSWQTRTYKHDDPELTSWLARGGNYGVVSHNGIGTLDIDEFDVFSNLGLEIPDSFTDCREGKRFHVYFRCNDLPDEIKATKVKTTWGDVRFPGHNSYVVGSGCVAPNKEGNIFPYEVINEQEIVNIPWGVLKKMSNHLDAPVETTNNSVAPKKEPYVMTDGVKKNHYTVVSYVGAELRKNVPISAIHAAIQSMNANGYFDRKRAVDELTKETDEAIAYCSRKQAASPSKPKSKGKSQKGLGKEETPEYNNQERGWFERDGSLYLEVIENINSDTPVYQYATLKDGKVSFIDELVVSLPQSDDSGDITISGVKYVPRKLIKNKDGQPIKIVGVPDKKVLSQITETNISEIKDMMVHHVLKYCDMSANDLDLCVYYIVTTWFYPKLSTIPYLRFRADTGKGKSRILKVISDLCFLPVKAGGASTASGTIRFHEFWHGTLVIDEADIKGEASDSNGYTNDMIKYLNLGFEKGQYFIKSDKVDPKQQEVFDPFCPKVIAMRGVFQDPATEGRCLSISPSETENKDIPSILPAEYETSTDNIRAMLAHYTITHWGDVCDADPYPSLNDVECEHRLKQLGSPLAKVLSKILPDGLSLFKHYIERRQVEIKSDRAMSFIGSIVNAVYDKAIEQEYVTPGSISDELGSTTTKITRTLKDAGMDIVQKRVTITSKDGFGNTTGTKSKSLKTIVVKNAKVWREICKRYIIAKEEQNSLIDTIVTCPTSIRGAEFV